MSTEWRFFYKTGAFMPPYNCWELDTDAQFPNSSLVIMCETGDWLRAPYQFTLMLKINGLRWQSKDMKCFTLREAQAQAILLASNTFKDISNAFGDLEI